MTFRAIDPLLSKIYYAEEADRPITTVGIQDGSLVIFTDSGLEDSFDAVANEWFSREQITQSSSGKTAGLAVVEFLSESAIINNQNYYIGWKSQKAGTNKNRVQLLNPAASGKTLILSAIWLVFQANDDEVQIRFNRGSAVGAINSVPINTYLGGAASVATIYTANTTSVDGTYGFDIEPSIGAAASGDGSVVINIIETTGMVIPAGGDIILVNNTATNDITVGFSYKEVTA